MRTGTPRTAYFAETPKIKVALCDNPKWGVHSHSPFGHLWCMQTHGTEEAQVAGSRAHQHVQWVCGSHAVGLRSLGHGLEIGCHLVSGGVGFMVSQCLHTHPQCALQTFCFVSILV